MAGQGDFDLTRLERMERRLQSREDAEAIRNLKSRYAALCDDIAALFAEDATWDSPGLGRFEGRGAAGIFSFAIHYSLNGQIYMDGDTARAQWYLFMPCTVADGNRAMWRRASIDHERYRRVDGSWLFSEKRSQPLMNVPFDEGWAHGGLSERIGVPVVRVTRRYAAGGIMFVATRGLMSELKTIVSMSAGRSRSVTPAFATMVSRACARLIVKQERMLRDRLSVALAIWLLAP